MTSRTSRPKWWLLYLTFPLLVGLFLVDEHLDLSSTGHEIAQLGILLLVFGLIQLWIKANARALNRMDRTEYHASIRVIEFPPSELPREGEQARPLFQIPAEGIKGVLSDTFDMDYIDARSFPVEKVDQQQNKE